MSVRAGELVDLRERAAELAERSRARAAVGFAVGELGRVSSASDELEQGILPCAEELELWRKQVLSLSLSPPGGGGAKRLAILRRGIEELANALGVLRAARAKVRRMRGEAE